MSNDKNVAEENQSTKKTTKYMGYTIKTVVKRSGDIVHVVLNPAATSEAAGMALAIVKSIEEAYDIIDDLVDDEGRENKKMEQNANSSKTEYAPRGEAAKDTYDAGYVGRAANPRVLNENGYGLTNGVRPMTQEELEKYCAEQRKWPGIKAQEEQKESRLVAKHGNIVMEIKTTYTSEDACNAVIMACNVADTLLRFASDRTDKPFELQVSW